ncbi:Tyrosine recombinase XerD [Leucobacter soli]|uniref:Tyrosine recombinase XerD n=2 Tax=Leucobacter soli TaxID=2812850 RepID=A0A916K0C5_9MICO|nr:Tyrosine recombinase XerD [Leucobacter soli]
MSVSAVERAQFRWHAADMNDAILDAFAIYQRSQRLALTTIKNRRHLLDGFSRRASLPLLQATTQDLRADLAREGVEPGTIRTERGALQAFYRFAVEDGYLTVDPSAALKPVRVPKNVARPFSVAQIEALLSSGVRRRTRAMILLGYYQGFRVSQIARVRGDDVDLLSGRLRTVAKGDKVRWVPLHPVIAELALDMPRVGWWFPARDGSDTPIQGASVTDIISKAKRRAGITDPKLTPHSLRHSCGTELGEAGVDLRVIQEILLHETIQSTEIYTAVSERRKRDGVEALPTLRLAA